MGIKEIIIQLMTMLPAKYIVFESYPDFSDNTKPVFDEMIKRGLNEKNKFVWILRDGVEGYPEIKNVSYVQYKSVKSKFILMRTKVVICSNAFIHSFNKNAVHFFLSHGTAVKKTLGYYKVPDFIQYSLATSLDSVEMMMNQHQISRERVFGLGFPRNDAFTEPPLDLHQYLDIPFKRSIIWYPTFRQKKSGRMTGSEHAIPIIWDEERAKRLNEYAREKKVLLIIKPHYAQDVSCIKNLNLSNIIFIYDEFFKKNNIVPYRFLGSCDALLTDYSSVYFDYSLCDKPIGLIWEDYEEYEKDPGFSIDMDYMMKGGVKIYTLEELESFIDDVSSGVDRLREERREIRDKINYSTDGKNAKRVADFIIEKTGAFIE